MPHIKVYSLEFAIAEKFEAISSNDGSKLSQPLANVGAIKDLMTSKQGTTRQADPTSRNLHRTGIRQGMEMESTYGKYL